MARTFAVVWQDDVVTGRGIKALRIKELLNNQRIKACELMLNCGKRADVCKTLVYC